MIRINRIKKHIYVIPCVLLVGIVLAFCLVTGGKRYDVVLANFETTEDGSVIVLDVSVASSMGYTRTLTIKDKGNHILLTFYSTYGLNSPYGANNLFPIELAEECSEIYFLGVDGEWELVLQKNAMDRTWSIPT